MEWTEMLRTGLTAAIPVAVACVLIVFVRSGEIEATTSAEGSAVRWVITWSVISLMFGILAVWAYRYMESKWSWGPGQYLGLAIASAVVLSALLFVKIFEGHAHVYRIEYTAFNFVYAIGFGTLIPKLAG